jgi:hypothetical protein
MPITYHVAEHDGGFGYRLGDVWSETYPEHESALAAANAAAARQQVGGEDIDTRFSLPTDAGRPNARTEAIDLRLNSSMTARRTNDPADRSLSMRPSIVCRERRAYQSWDLPLHGLQAGERVSFHVLRGLARVPI